MKPQWNRFRPYRRGDLPTIWRSLRPEDYREFSAFGLTDPLMLEEFILTSSLRVTCWDTESGPVALYGVTPDQEPGVGHIWAVASTAAQPRWRFAVRNTEGCLKVLGEGFLLLTNVKDSRNTTQINWLRHLGFTFFRTEEDFCGTGVPFHQFVRIVS